PDAVAAVVLHAQVGEVGMLPDSRVQLPPEGTGVAARLRHLGHRLQYSGDVVEDALLEVGRLSHRPGAGHVAPVAVHVAPRVDDVQLAFPDRSRSSRAAELAGAEVAAEEVDLAGVELRRLLA